MVSEPDSLAQAGLCLEAIEESVKASRLRHPHSVHRRILYIAFRSSLIRLDPSVFSHPSRPETPSCKLFSRSPSTSPSLPVYLFSFLIILIKLSSHFFSVISYTSAAINSESNVHFLNFPSLF
jgi:hypothetical protein